MLEQLMFQSFDNINNYVGIIYERFFSATAGWWNLSYKWDFSWDFTREDFSILEKFKFA